MITTRLPTLTLLLLSATMLIGCRQEVSPAWQHGDIAFASNRDHGNPYGPLFMMSGDGKRWAPIQGSRPSIPGGPSWLPDSSVLAFVDFYNFNPNDHARSGILLLVDENDQTSRVPFGPCRFFPAWAPNGDHLAFYTECDGQSALAIADPIGADEISLVDDLPLRRTPEGDYRMRITWSPDSQALAYDRRIADDEYEIWTVNVDGTGNRRVTSGKDPAWSPASDEIAFVREEDIWIHSLDSGEERLFLDDPVRAEWPEWSPDASELAFMSWRDVEESSDKLRSPNVEIYKIRLEDGKLTNLTRNPAWDGYPAWRRTAVSASQPP